MVRGSGLKAHNQVLEIGCHSLKSSGEQPGAKRQRNTFSRPSEHSSPPARNDRVLQAREATERLTPFISPNLRLDILACLWEEYRDEVRLAADLDSSPALVHRWLTEGEAPDDGSTAHVLALGMQRSSRVKEMLRLEVLEQVDGIFTDLNIAGEVRNEQDLGRIMEFLDEKSRQILWYLWWNRHAEISELVELTRAYSDMDVLLRIRGVINLAGREILGRELVRFEDSRIDPVTGEKVLFSWWLEDDALLTKKRREPLVDIFEEDDHIAVIAQLPAPIELDGQARVENKDGLLRITVGKSGRPESKEHNSEMA
ncbi:MAG: hypothetical protein HQ578_04880 [Chloroflexi bacterium]|nr:hypothetical protein [Chloroflexota bacterium]